jgi:hypothetical protein
MEVTMPVRSDVMWERMEREEWRTIMPITGRRAADSTLLNPTAGRVLDELKEGRTPGEIITILGKAFPDVETNQLRNDVRGVVCQLQELEVYEMSDMDVKSLTADECTRLPGFHVMDEAEIEEVAERLKLEEGAEEGAFRFYDAQSHVAEAFAIRLRHFNSTETMFVHNDASGRMDGLVSLLSLAELSPVQQFGRIVVCSSNPKGAEDAVKRLLGEFEELALRMLGTGKLRFAVRRDSQATSEEAPLAQIIDDPAMFVRVLGELAYRREAFLPDEFGPGMDLELFSKRLGAR